MRRKDCGAIRRVTSVELAGRFSGDFDDGWPKYEEAYVMVH